MPGVLWAPDAPPAKGEEAIRKSYSDLLAANTVTNASLTNTHYQMCGDLSIGWGEFTLALAQVWSQSDYPVWPIYRRREEGRRQMALRG